MIHRVSDPGNPGLAPYSHVADPRWLRAEGLFVAEGRLVVRRLAEVGRFPIVSVLVTPAAHAALGELLSALGCDVYICSQQTLNGVTGFDFHRGCLALARRGAPAPAATLLGGSRLLALEGVGNPDNIGGLFRTAGAFGVAGVLLDPRSGDPLYRKAIRTSMAATLRVPFARVHEWPGGLEPFRAAGFHVVALTPHAEAAPIEAYAASLDPALRLILLVGAEGPGLSDEALATADARVRIPVDPQADSLNVTVAAGIALDRLR